MEATTGEKKENTVQGKKKGWQKWGIGFLNFLAMGGWILIAIAFLGILILVSRLSK